MRAVKNTNNTAVTDDQVLQILRGHRGRGMASDKVAHYFGVSPASMRHTLQRLTNEKRIRERSIGGHRLFYIPMADEIEREQRNNVVHAFPEYRMPKAMRDQLESIRAERARYPSKF